MPMKKLEKSDLIPAGTDMMAGIDLYGKFKQLFKFPIPSPGCIFLLCVRGTCTLTIHLTQYQMKVNSIAIIFPDLYVQLTEQSPDCRFIFVGFSQKLIRSSRLFSHTIEYTPYIFEKPVLKLEPPMAEIFYNTFMLQIKSLRYGNGFMSETQMSLAYSMLILNLGYIYKQKPNLEPARYNRNQEIVKELVRIVIQYYKTERNVSFYAEKMHLSPQHLSTTIKKITGKTLTDIISSFIIHDAQAKLRSTEMTIQEIAYSLNFPDISFFGKYFKRYTGMSPKQYRNTY